MPNAVGGAFLYRRFRDSRWTVPLLLALSIAPHVIWLILLGHSHLHPIRSEMWQVAVSIAQRGIIANPYKVWDNVPTTHVGPIAAAPAALVYWLFGVATPASEAILSCFALSAVVAINYLIYQILGLLGESALLRRAGLLAVAHVPVNLETEAQDFRVREGAYAAAILFFLLYWVLRRDRERDAR